MSINEYRNKTKEELIKMISDQKKELAKTVESLFQKNEQNVHKPRTLRKELARMNTVLKEKEILGE